MAEIIKECCGKPESQCSCNKPYVVDRTLILSSEIYEELKLKLQNLQGSGACNYRDIINVLAPTLIEKGRQMVIKKIEAMDKRHTVGFILQALKKSKDV